jgi:uncharacterized membrane protein
MNEPIMSRIAIILLALVMAVFGFYHFLYPQNLVAYLPSFLPQIGKLPVDIWVYIPGAAFILCAVAFITNRKVRLAGYVLAILLFIFVYIFIFYNFTVIIVILLYYIIKI